MENILTSIPKLKDNLLALIAIDYGIGFASWSVYSYINSLGINSAFESQYLIAGIIPFLLIGYTWWFFMYSNKFIISTREKINRKAVGLYKHIRIFIIWLPFISVLIMILLAHSLKKEKDFFNFLPFILIIFCLGGALRPQDTYPIYISKKSKINFKSLLRLLRLFQKTNNFFSSFTKYYSLLVLTIVLLPFYYIRFYPNIPQELGGVKPKKCLLIFDKEESDNKPLFSIMSNTLRQKGSIISDTLLVYYCNDNKCIVKKDKWDQLTYEIDRKSINTLIWINE